MDEVWDVIKYVLPALLVYLVTVNTQKRFFKQEEDRRLFELKKNNLRVSTPVRFRAYERLMLFLERITPENLVMRIHQHDMNSMQLHTELLKNIRTEYEHNLSQQLYVTAESWSLVVTAKESVIKILNTTVSGINPQVPAIELLKEFIENYHDEGQAPVELAKAQLKKEVSQYF